MTLLARTTKMALCSLAVFMLLGCAQQMVRDRATDLARAGKYEEAIRTLEDGTNRYPDSLSLRSGLVTTKSEAVVRLVAESSRLRTAGRFDEALVLLKRAKEIEPRNERVEAQLADITLDKQLQKSLDAANALASSGKRNEAIAELQAAMRLSPRQPVLAGLLRQLEAEARLETPRAASQGLAETRPITLDFRNAALSTILQAITQRSGINFVLDRDVRQDSRATVYLRSAPVGDAIDLVLGAQQLARKTIDSQTVLIYPNTPDKLREHQEQVLRVFYLANADAKSTAAMLRSLLRLKEPFVDERANYVAIREAPELVALAERLVALHDVSDGEVMLEVEILEVKTTRLTELGINFPNSFSLTPLAPTGSSTLTLGNLRSINEGRVGVNVSGLLFNLRREVGDFNTLANPRIRAKSREKARILIGDKVPVVTATTTSSGFVAETINYIDVGLKLEVEPLVSPDDDVTIKLALEVSSTVKEIRTASGSVAFQIGTRNATTALRLRDGETQVLGGLISNEDRSSANRVPGLGDLPIAGRLFSSQKDDLQRTELVLAITPRILRSAPQPSAPQTEMWVGTEALTRLRPPPRIATAAGTLAQSPVASNSVGKADGATSNESVAKPAVEEPKGLRLNWQVPSEVKVGEIFTARLNLSADQLVRGAPFELEFQPGNMEVVQVSEGTFFRRDGASTSFSHTVNTSTRRIGVGILRSQDAGVDGSGTLVELQLRAIAPGPIELPFTSIRLLTHAGPVAPESNPLFRTVARP